MNQGIYAMPLNRRPPTIRRQLWLQSYVVGNSISASTSATLNRVGFCYYDLPAGTRVTAVALLFGSSVASSTLRWAPYDCDGLLPSARLHAGGVFADIGGSGTSVQYCAFVIPSRGLYMAGCAQGVVPNVSRHVQNVVATPYGINTIHATTPQLNNNPGSLYLSASYTGALPAFVNIEDLAPTMENAHTTNFGLQVVLP